MSNGEYSTLKCSLELKRPCNAQNLFIIVSHLIAVCHRLSVVFPLCCYDSTMSRDLHLNARSQHDGEDPEESEALLSHASNGQDTPPPRTTPSRPPAINRRQSSFSKAPPNGQPRAPRTPNRVRFDLDVREDRGEDVNSPGTRPNEDADWVENEDYLPTGSTRAGRSSTGQRAPLLTGIEAPSVTVANAEMNLDADDLLENARPKSGMGSAFMNMANSIM